MIRLRNLLLLVLALVASFGALRGQQVPARRGHRTESCAVVEGVVANEAQAATGLEAVGQGAACGSASVYCPRTASPITAEDASGGRAEALRRRHGAEPMVLLHDERRLWSELSKLLLARPARGAEHALPCIVTFGFDGPRLIPLLLFD